MNLKKLLEKINGEFFEQASRLQEIETDFAQQRARWAQQEQTLSIGIMGQVKAGKSSFLNALLFDGEPILPEAATPKTANLTKVSYGEQFALYVSYYHASEWADIVAQSQGSTDTVETKVARELVAMANQLPPEEVQRCLNVQQETITQATLNDLQGVLNQYTGNDGSHAPLVKSTEIALPREELKGFEVVDTPGMNDPVASRTQKTREYMAHCDVVFFLSRCSQFLDQSDMDLLSDQLPNKGIKRLVLVAGQYDSVILDDGYDRDSLKATEENIQTRLRRTANNKAQELAERKGHSDAQYDLLHNSLAAPVFASTFAYGFAQWPASKWTHTMQHIHKELTELAEDEWDDAFTQADWQRLGNFSVLQAAFDQAKTDRETLLAQQRASVLPQYHANRRQALLRLDEQVNSKIDVLRTKGIKDIQTTKTDCHERIEAISNTLKRCLGNASQSAQSEKQAVLQQLTDDQQRFQQLDTRKGSRSEEYSYEVSDSRWYKPWRWGSTRTVYRTKTVSYDYLCANDAIEQVQEYGRECVASITKAFDALVSPKEIKQSLRKSLAESLNTRDDNYDPILFRNTLDQAIAQLSLPQLNIQLGDEVTREISRHFQGEVTSNDQMQHLKDQLHQALAEILNKVQHRFSQEIETVINRLKQTETTLKEQLTERFMASLDQLEQDLQDKKKKIEAYETLLSDIEQMSHATPS